MCKELIIIKRLWAWPKRRPTSTSCQCVLSYSKSGSRYEVFVVLVVLVLAVMTHITKRLFQLDSVLLKFMTLLTDNLNGIIKQIGNIVDTTEAQKVSAYLAVIFPGILLVTFGLIYTPLLNVHQLRDNGKKCFGKIVNIIVSWSVFFGGISYFVGDNIVETTEQILTDDNFNGSMIMTGDTANVLTTVRSIHPVLLILALILHDILPYEFKQAQNKDSRGKHSKSDDKERKEDTDYSLYKEMVNTAVLIIKFDSWFTIIQSAGSCASPVQLGLVWFLWFLLSFGVYGILIGIKLFSYCDGHRHVGQIHFRSNLFYGLIMAIVFLIAFALSLLGDNSQPLDCYQQVSPTVKLFFLLISFLSFLSSFVIYIVYLSFTGERSKFNEEDNCDQSYTVSNDLQLEKVCTHRLKRSSSYS